MIVCTMVQERHWATAICMLITFRKLPMMAFNQLIQKGNQLIFQYGNLKTLGKVVKLAECASISNGACNRPTPTSLSSDNTQKTCTDLQRNRMPIQCPHSRSKLDLLETHQTHSGQLICREDITINNSVGFACTKQEFTTTKGDNN